MSRAVWMIGLIAAVASGACAGGGGGDCTPHLAQYCQEGVSYWVNSCGDLEELAETCSGACKADRSACDYPDLVVGVTPAQVTVELGQQQQFTATVSGSANQAVTWRVLPEAGHGTISATGLYSAPAALPAPATATVQAISVADPARSASAAVSLTEPDVNPVPEEERVLCLVGFGMSDEVGDLGDELVDLAAQAVWGASEWNGGQATFTGTLTQAAPGSETFTYSATPNDRLVIAYADGTRIEFQFTTFQGYVDGTWEDFTRSHDLDFRVLISGKLDLQVQSAARPGTPDDPAYSFRSDYERRLIGQADYEGEWVTLDITYGGKEQWHVDGQFAFYDYEEAYSGSASTRGISFSVNEAAHASLTHDARIGSHIRNHQLWNHNQATYNGVTYAFVNAYVAWAMGSLLNDPGTFSVVIDTNYWECGGTVTRGGQIYGTVGFDGPVVADSHGPELILKLTSGEDVLLHTLIDYP